MKLKVMKVTIGSERGGGGLRQMAYLFWTVILFICFVRYAVRICLFVS